MKDSTKWWDGYEYEPRIVVDDFDGEWPYRNFLRFLDRYKYQGEIKNGYTKINSKEIYITSEYEPEHYWKEKPKEWAQIQRRIDEVINLHNGNKVIYSEAMRIVRQNHLENEH